MERVGIAGLGLLGRGIAACFLGHGYEVVAYTRKAETHESARRYIAEAIDDLVRRAGFPASLTAEWADRYQAVDRLEAMATCDLVIESVVEDLEAKQQVFDVLEAVLDPEAPIASNTSALPISQLQRHRVHPSRFLGMHWCEPAHATRFLEIIRGEQTSDAIVARAMALARSIGKDPSLVLKDVPAFVINRIGYAMYREALHIVEMGVADFETVDRSFRNALGLWSTLLGPFRWIDLTGGPALYAKAMAPVLPTLSAATEVPHPLQELADAGAQGITNGRGFYPYTPEEIERWERLFREHAWRVRELAEEYYPLETAGNGPAPA